MKAFLKVLLILPLLLLISFGIYREVDYSRHVQGYLKRAADANTVPLAEKQLSIALKEMEQRGLTSGSTHILYSTPDTDVEFWYSNIKAAHSELLAIGPESSQLEQTNILMKLRESLLDEGGKSVKVTDPENISLFPNQKFLFYCLLFSLVLFMIAFFDGVLEHI